jgi:hypothetical protein
MPNITMLDIERAETDKAQAHTSRNASRTVPRTRHFHAMMGHNIDLCEAMFVAWDTLFNTGASITG